MHRARWPLSSRSSRISSPCKGAPGGRLAVAWLLAWLLASMLAGCEALDSNTRYACTGQGYVHRYRDGNAVDSTAGDRIAFSLGTYRLKSGFAISAVGTLVEMQNPAIVLDKNGSNDVERLYAYDVVDARTGQRTVTTLVFNQVSGDFRLFHHRWIPPVQWHDSDQYFYSGNCLKRAT